MPLNVDQSDRPLVQMVVQLDAVKASGEILTSEESAVLANTLLTRVTSELGRPAARINILRHIAAIIVEADEEFQATLARQPEVKSVRANQSNESLSMPPVRKRPV